MGRWLRLKVHSMTDGSTMIVDLANLEWWQTLVALIGILGLSPAPWILGLATGKIQFSTPAENNYSSRIEDLKQAQVITAEGKDKAYHDVLTELTKHHEEIRQFDLERYSEMKRSRDGYRHATAEQRDRADKATETALRAVEAVEATNHVLNSLNQVITEGAEAE